MQTSRHTLSDTNEKQLFNDFNQITKQLPPSDQKKLHATLCQEILRRVLAKHQFHDDLHSTLNDFVAALQTSRLIDAESLTDTTSHLSELLKYVYWQCAIWHPAPGRTGRQLQDTLDSIIRTLKDLQPPPLANILEKMASINATATKRQTASEQRQLTSHLHQEKFAHMQHVVFSTLNNLFENAYLPEEIASYLRETLPPALNYLLMNEGESSSAWRTWQQFLAPLAWVFPGPDVDKKQRLKIQSRLYEQGPQLLEFITPDLLNGFSDYTTHQHYLELLSALIAQRIRTEEIPNVVSFEPFTLQKNPHSGLKVDTTSDHILASLKVNRWFRNNNNTGPSTALKIAHIDGDFGTTYFSDYYGKIALQLNPEEAHIAVASGALAPIMDSVCFYQQSVTQILSILIKRTQQYQEKYEEKRQQEKKKAEYIRLSQEKAKQEAEKLEQRRRSRKFLPTEVSEDNLKPVKMIILKLQLGAWVEFTFESGMTSIEKLSLIVRSSDKYLFCNELGQKTRELNIDEFSRLLATKQSRIINTGEHFEHQLEKIVRGIRKNMT
ncbi:DUF1631 family protein [Marinibactrum halimedae]|uniref:DUF1631 family protein n=1 Tax=Marinibactrum halimedae TaxID=1444977 RepID=A0AA37TEC0_9GAMM|nr:DUF1631 family protein [Marinibactrum halimedae]MCD9459426.1 DUF1631 domain-containing protein [Marinibactrum halimedae]GLS27507.1 hypothetical protein GCM10007877_32260 [Marinibactrum halimedae]